MKYTTKNKIESYALKEIDSSFDDVVDGFIKAMSLWVSRYCGDDLIPKRRFTDPIEGVRKFDGNGKERLEVGDLLEIINITVNGSEVDYTLYPLNAKMDGEPYQTIILNDGRCFEKGNGNVEVEAKWGYSEEVPKDVELATTKLCTAIIKESNVKDVREITSEKFDDYSVKFTEIKNIANSLNVDKLLKPFKRKVDSRATLGQRQI